VRLFEQPDILLANTWIVVRIDGRGFSKYVRHQPPPISLPVKSGIFSFSSMQVPVTKKPKKPLHKLGLPQTRFGISAYYSTLHMLMYRI
jgi:hypothetical protein